MQPNIIFYFSDQQRADTFNERVMPNVTELARDGTVFDNSFTCQPVCGPARACLQTGVYATQCGCFWNGIPLPRNIKPLAEYFNEAGYETAYVGKWHLASDRYPKIGFHCEAEAVPRERRGGYKDYWRAADVLEFTSHAYDGFVFDGDGNKVSLSGYRSDSINSFALDYIADKSSDKPFFLFVSQLEPHHQNDHGAFEGPKDTVESFRDYPIPDDLSFLKGNYKEQYPDYIAAINRLDSDVGELVQLLKDRGLYDNTVIIYTSDHGCHFKTRNLEYKRSCHESAIHTPLIVSGGAWRGPGRYDGVVSLIDLPPTMLELAGIKPPESYMGISLLRQLAGEERENVFMQISESQVGRAIRTRDFKYSVRSPKGGMTSHSAVVYYEDYLYDLRTDLIEKNNLIKDPAYAEIRKSLRQQLTENMCAAGEKKPDIRPARTVRKK